MRDDPEQPLEALCIGETMVLVSPESGTPLSLDSTCKVRAAGAESNVAMGLAALGHCVAWAGRVGNDPLGHIITETLAGGSVRLDLVEFLDHSRTGVFFKNPSPEGTTTVHYYRQGSAASTMDPLFINTLTMCSPRLVHLSGITPALSQTCRQLTEHVLFTRAFSGASVSLDINYRPQLWERPPAQELLSYANAADIVFVGLDEAQALWHVETAEDVRSLIPEPEHLVVKDGAVEAVAFSDSGTTRVPALKVDVVEVVGAGDAFAAGWLSAYFRDLSEDKRLLLGHRIASAALQSVTDQGVIPDIPDLCRGLGVSVDQWQAHNPGVNGANNDHKGIFHA